MNERRLVNARPDGRNEARRRWLYGLNAVARRLEVDPTSVRELYLLRGDSRRREALIAAARRASVPVREVDAITLQRLTGTDHHQGVAALSGPFRYHDLERLVAISPGPLLLLGQLNDPHNFGALVRTAAAAGMAAVVVPRHGAVGVTAAVEKVAAGAVNDVPICQVANLHRCLLDLRSAGYWSVALTPEGGQNLFAMEVPQRPVLVLGGESGLRPLVEQTCDLRATIPVRGGVESLNASVAGAIAMYEIMRRLGALTG